MVNDVPAGMRRAVRGTVLWRGLGVAALLVVAACSPPVRRRCLTYGATAEEAAAALPGDDLLPRPDVVSTRAVTIGAAASAVWPWLVQMGSGRGGAYTYDWIENLFGLDMHSADEILPQFQRLAAGDVLPLGPDGPGMRVEICDPETTLAFRSDDGRWVWTFHVRTNEQGTRLISRNRIASGAAPWLRRVIQRAVIEPGSLIMERRMLRGIRDRAERGAAPVPVPARSS
ncbi:SRPBCC family protein [Actinoplanes awajinensis]|nr:SRPBCC family protein [Actinoplanes awajinensis]